MNFCTNPFEIIVKFNNTNQIFNLAFSEVLQKIFLKKLKLAKHQDF